MIDHGTKAGTVGGTLLSMCPTISSGDIYRTVVLAFVGAVVSFIASVILKRIVSIIKKRYLK